MAERDSICVPVEKLDDSFREISGYPGYYLRSDGTAWSSWVRDTEVCRLKFIRSNELRKMAVRKNRFGYHLIFINRGNGRMQSMFSRAMLRAFVGEPPTPKHCACHCDGNKDNNAIENLRWDTRAGNEADKIIHGTSNRGARNGMAVLTESQVKEIRELYRAVPAVKQNRPPGTLRAIAAKVGLPPSIVASVAYHGWADVAGGPIKPERTKAKEGNP